ncbi:DUF6333 family protein [Streptomyces sp. NRRL S-1813]|uniref:DUF6333 family protein n=1 Tax=Streptomyces sp. NRRL S-1813 TaxID=1463888 RepID=UPI00131D4D58|nr:DUF6333 family protein [Streptomyces sp. NRRL S-1813]
MTRAMSEMTDETPGGKPGNGAEEVVPKWGSRAELTLRFPPFPEPDVTVGPASVAHDPVRARQVVEELGTIAEVLEQLPDRPLGDVSDPRVRADLDLVAVGCWGNVVHIIEPALGSDLLTPAMTLEVRRQRARHPQARIVGSLEIDYGNSYCEDVVDLPGGVEAFAGGWDCDDEWEFSGDPEAVLRAIGVDRGAAADAGFELDEEPLDRVWSDLGNLAIWGLHAGAAAGLPVSVFRVRRTPEAAIDLKEVWFGR